MRRVTVCSTGTLGLSLTAPAVITRERVMRPGSPPQGALHVADVVPGELVAAVRVEDVQDAGVGVERPDRPTPTTGEPVIEASACPPLRRRRCWPRANEAKVVKTGQVRADTTVVAADVTYPTHSGLLVRDGGAWDSTANAVGVEAVRDIRRRRTAVVGVTGRFVSPGAGWRPVLAATRSRRFDV